MILHTAASHTADQLKNILAKLKTNPEVQDVVLATEDGLVIQEISTQPAQLAATAGFILTTARQSCAMLGMDGCHGVRVYTTKGYLLVSYVFQVEDTRLLLILVLQKELNMKRMALQTIKAIQKLMEN